MSGPLLLALRLLAALALYAFLGLAIWTLARDLRAQGERLARHTTPPILVRIRLPGLPETERSFAQPELLIGRHPACAITLEDETVSARHARLRFHHGQWWLEDLGSTNGTRLNGEVLRIAAVLTAGDRIECGAAALTVGLSAAGISPTLPRNEREGS